MPNWNFFQARPDNVDFTPLVQGAEMQAQAASQAAASIAQGIRERQRMAEERRQFDQQMVIRQAIQASEAQRAAASDRRADASEARLQRSDERSAANDLRKQTEDQSTRDFLEQSGVVPRGTIGGADPQTALSAMGLARGMQADQAKASQQDAAAKVHAQIGSLPPGGIAGLTQTPDFAKMNPDDQRQAISLGLTSILRRQQAVQQEKKAADLQAETARTQSLIAALRDRGVLNPDQHAAMEAQVGREPGKVAKEALDLAGKKADLEHDTSLIDAAKKRWNSQAGEMEKLGQHEQAQELRAHAAAIGNNALSGKALQAQVYETDKLAEGLRPKDKEQKPAEVHTPSGGKIPDTVGFTKGGFVDDLINDRKSLAWFQSAAEQSAQKDARYPKQSEINKLEQGAAAAEDEKLAATYRSQAEAMKQQQQDIRHEHGESLLAMNGWTRKPDEAPATETAAAGGAQAGAASPQDTLRAEVQSGAFKGKSKEEFLRRAAELGVAIKPGHGGMQIQR